MVKIFAKVAAWIVRKLGLLLLLIAALLLAPSVMEVWRVAGQFDPVAVALELKKQTDQAVPHKSAPREEMQRKLKALRDKLKLIQAERAELSREACILPTCAVVKTAKLYRVEMEAELIEQALRYGEAISSGTKACAEHKRNSALREELKLSEAELERARPFYIPPAQGHSELKARITDVERLLPAQENTCQTYQRLSSIFAADQNTAQQKLGQKYGEFLVKLEELKQSRSAFLRSAKEVLPAAFTTLLAIILLPIGVKTFSYYVVATWASRRFGVRLLPHTSGELTVASAAHDLQRINLESGRELLIDPALLRSSPDSAAKSTKLLLDWSMPLSSLASGQYLLTRIRGDGNGTVTISDDTDHLRKITVLELPENAALVLQPRCLAGIVQSIERPLRITRHWRLGHLGSWLTLQLRYLVFHGPVKLIVRGNHGVEADSAQAGSSINQAATLGFSANLGYGVVRCEPFYAYLSGTKELFNDCFSSGPGYFVHEVRPQPARNMLLPGRGVEGILNSLLKIFGL